MIRPNDLKSEYDVLVLGGGPAGLSAAMALGRMMRSVLICDDKRPRNQASSHANNFVSQDGIDPAEWRQKARNDLIKYTTLQFASSEVETIVKIGHVFRAILKSGETIKVKKVILAHGITDKLPAAPGFAELWGKSIYHCPYCHGYEVRGKRLGLVGSGAIASHMLPMISALSSDLILFTNGYSEVPADLERYTEKKRIPRISAKITSLKSNAKGLQTVELEDGFSIERDGLFVVPQLPLTMKSDIGEKLGCEKTELGLYKILEMNKTTVPGVFAAGDIMTMHHSVLNAAATGQMAGAAVVAELLHEEF